MSNPDPLVTLGDSAKFAKVSRTTVSLALRNSPRISARMRTRVQALARELGYRQNPLVTAHMAYVRSLHPHYTGQCIALVCNRSIHEVEAATFAGRLHLAAAAHVRMLVSVVDAQGNVYLPGNRLVGPGPYRLHVEAWGPRPLTHLRIVHPGGVRESHAVDGNFVARDFTLPVLLQPKWAKR